MVRQAVERDKLTAKAVKGKKKDAVSRADFYEAARTLEDIVIGVSQGELWDSTTEAYTSCCCIQTDTIGESMAVAYLSDAQVRELIQVLKDYLSAKEG